MKKILALLLVAVMIVSFCAACAKNTTPSTTRSFPLTPMPNTTKKLRQMKRIYPLI